MKLVANVQLKPTPAQAEILRQTLERCNAACDWLAEQAVASGNTRQYDLHKHAYFAARKRFDLQSDVTVRCIAKVADAFKVGDKTKTRTFRKHAAQPYNDRLLRIKPVDQISLWCIGGRQVIPFVCGARQRKLLEHRKGEMDLMYVGKKWYIAFVCDIPDPEQEEIEDVIGVDFGIVNLAVDSDGATHSGTKIVNTNRRYNNRRKRLQKKGTQSAKRKLKKLSGKQRRYQKDTNHRISKQIVETAKRTCRGIALEDLRGIRSRVTARRR